MNDAWTALLAGVLAGLGGLGVPALIRRVPEPPPAQAPEESVEEPAKEPYAAIAALPGLGWRSALAALVAGALVGWATGPDWSLLWLVPLVPVGVALSVVDWRTRLLPRLVVLPATALAIVAVVAVGLATGDTSALVRALVAMLVVRSFFWVLWFLHSAGMGFGDVRLAAVVGLVLGWVGWGTVAIGVWVGFMVFALPGVVLALVRRDRALLRKPFPYGPFMLVGDLVGLVWGPALAARLWS
ncbi:MAG: A24 family peptidase [Nocardioides sp.]|nr:A24 family peptidase [Nocardioides sp.]